MSNGQSRHGAQQASVPGQSPIAAPTISLPKGGGAIRGMGEKFAANPVIGTGALSVPIATSPGRAGFGPQLSLAYDSGAGNGPFGLGWSLALPAITRKTDKGLPHYRDAEESDVFLLSGVEDLVPVLMQTGGTWSREPQLHRTVDNQLYAIQRYRPRIEGLFARIERWTNQADSQDTFWRSISRENITTWYGKTAESRIAAPADPTRIFSWLICESYDDKGNVIVYGYKEENSDNVQRTQAHERNRTDLTRAANRYPKRIRYGNHTPYLPTLSATDPWPTPPGAIAVDGSTAWYFEVVFDYGEHDSIVPTPHEAGLWNVRPDPFSAYRATFDVRTYRLCQRVLMFHHFPNEPGVGGNCLVSSTDFTYAYEDTPADPRDSIYACLRTVAHMGYRRQGNGYLSKALPPLQFTYTQPIIDETVRDVDAASLDNLPYGLDGKQYQWVDLDGEGLSGILTEHAGCWWYKRNLSPLNVVQDNGPQHSSARFAPLEQIAEIPSMAAGNGRPHQLLDLAGDGQLDLVAFEDPTPGFFERTKDEGWRPFTPFTSLPVLDWNDPHLKFIDLTGDGHADLLIHEDTVFCWHASLAEAGFGPAQRVSQALDEERGPRLMFAGSTQSIFSADLSGDGLTDLVRIRNGEVCYWPNLGYGCFGAKVTMDNAPWFETPDLFDGRRLRLADIDGSGTTDILYLASDGVQIYFNQSGNGWSSRRVLGGCSPVENVSTVSVVDLLGNGTACLVWSSPLPGNTCRPMRYIDLMGGQKPHLLVTVVNNLGAETHVSYAPSTRFYLADKDAGHPWVTRLPFPVHVVERVETHDVISRTRFVTHYAYHHGYFDGVEREFRGFGMVEQFDTEAFAVLSASGTLPDTTNLDTASHVPPILTRTWFHTGAYLDRDRISRQFEHEYYREPGLHDAQLSAMQLDDTVLPPELSATEEREACRALKGSMLRQEIYACDGSVVASQPYTVAEQNYTIKLLQPRSSNQQAVFFTHAREAVSCAYDRTLYDWGAGPQADPRVSHTLTLAVDDYGNVQQAVAISYGRRFDDPDPLLTATDRQQQQRTFATYTESGYTNPVVLPDAYRTPLSCELRTYELFHLAPAASQSQVTNLFRFGNVVTLVAAAGDGQHERPYEDVEAGVATGPGPYRRLIEHGRALYSRDNLTGGLPLAHLEPLALPFESYRLALTPGLVTQTYEARVTDVLLATEGHYVHSQGDANWWIPSGRIFYTPAVTDTPVQELAAAQQHFFLPRRFQDPFGQVTAVTYDRYDLLLQETRDPLGNLITVLTQDEQGHPVVGLDYRVLQPWLMTDPNGNRMAVAYDTLGMVVGTAVMGKLNETQGDSLAGFAPDLDNAMVVAHLQNPLLAPGALLAQASTRLVYDLFAFQRTASDPQPQPSVVYTLVRETHATDLAPSATPLFQHTFTYADGFGRVMQQKIQAEPGPLVAGGIAATPRWIGSGWAIFNNKGQPVKQYEPFFSATHGFEFAMAVGVSPTLCYDPIGRVVATLHPNHSYTKVAFDPWRLTSWDVNDTVLHADPALDPDIGDWFRRLPADSYLPTWYAARVNGQLGAAEQAAAQQAAAHAGTPTVAYVDTLGRPYLTIANNGAAGQYATRVELDIEGNQRSTSDPRGRMVMVNAFDMLGTTTSQASMEAGTHLTLHDVAGKPLHVWDSRDHHLRYMYDALQRPTHLFVRQSSGPELLAERIVYGEAHPNALVHNLRGRTYQHYDSAGVSTTEQYDFKGNLLLSSRQLTSSYQQQVDWSPLAQLSDTTAVASAAAPLLETERFTINTTFDGLNRPITLTTPDQSVIRPVYNEANLLEQVSVNLRGATTATPFVSDIDYDAKGQRQQIVYSNGITTTYTYDPLTFRLAQIQTLRTETLLQDLFYTYDPVGNITAIRDDAQQTVYFNNQVVAPSASYTYDALYRLVAAEGREHIGQLAQPQTTHDDAPRINQPHPGDGQALRRYSETYAYDEVDNILSVIHAAAGGNWTRIYAYNESSLIEPAKKNNRLSSTTVSAITELYYYDTHGNMTSMSHLAKMEWDFEDQLQRMDLGGGGTVYYVYDAAGQRVRKVVERIGGQIEERIYLGGFEVYRVRNAGGLKLERETLHVMDGTRRVALVETKTVDTASSPFTPVPVIRFQYDNHLGSASLELDANGQIISYEEYYPYGNTSYQAVRGSVEVSQKRYRYTGKERDEESGLYYHGARYYAPWLGRWTSCDPLGTEDGLNVYLYVHCNPVAMSDPTGMWGRRLAILAAVVVVGIVVTVATAGAAAPIVAGAVASVGLSGAAATVATGVVVGAVAGAAGGVASEVTRQVANGEQLDGRSIGRAALQGAALGVVTGGLGAAASTARGAAAIARVSTAARATSVGRATVAASRAVGAGVQAVARVPGVRQVVGAAQKIAAVGGGKLKALEEGSHSFGTNLARKAFSSTQGLVQQGSKVATALKEGAAAVERFDITRSAARTFGATPTQGLLPIQGRLNAGGGDEPAGMLFGKRLEAWKPGEYSNLQPYIPGSGGPSGGVRDVIGARAEHIDKVLAPGSIKQMVSHRLAGPDFNVDEFAAASYSGMAKGGTFELNFGSGGLVPDLEEAAFIRVGFEDVKIKGQVVLTGRKP